MICLYTTLRMIVFALLCGQPIGTAPTGPARDAIRNFKAYRGSTPQVDGILEPGEWSDAWSFETPFVDGVMDWTPEFFNVTSSLDLHLTGWMKHDDKARETHTVLRVPVRATLHEYACSRTLRLAVWTTTTRTSVPRHATPRAHDTSGDLSVCIVNAERHTLVIGGPCVHGRRSIRRRCTSGSILPTTSSTGSMGRDGHRKVIVVPTRWGQRIGQAGEATPALIVTAPLLHCCTRYNAEYRSTGVGFTV